MSHAFRVVPKALYTDRKNVFVTDREPTVEEQLADLEPMTAFGKACKKLEIEIITANSPQAKGPGGTEPRRLSRGTRDS